MARALLCLDSGTTRVKAAVYSTEGDLLSFAEAENSALRRSGTSVIQDMEETRALNFSVVKECLRATQIRVDAMIVSAQGDGLWPIDSDGRPVFEGITWLDGRARSVLASLDEQGVLDQLSEITLSKPTTASQTVLLRWLQDESPSDFEKLAHALRLKDWLAFCLTGSLMTEASNILPVWGNPRTQELDERIPKLVGLAKGLEVIPESRHISKCFAELSADAAAELGIDYRFPVYVGPSDVQATAIGLGVGFRPGITSCSVFGTASIHVGYGTSAGSWKSAPAGSLIQPYSLMPGYVCLHPGFNGTNIFTHIDRFTGVAQSSRNVEPRPSELLVLPFFEEGGERSPFTDPNLRGGIFGLRASNTPEEIRWAARESLAFLGRVSQTMFQAGDVVAVGGGLSQDHHFMQFYADCLSRELQSFGSANVGLFGLALLLTSIVEPAAFDALKEHSADGAQVYKPRSQNRFAIERKFSRFEQLTQFALGFWSETDRAELSTIVPHGRRSVIISSSMKAS